MNDSNLIPSTDRAQRVRGSHWLAGVFATILLAAGTFAGCTDVGIDDKTCSVCPEPVVRYDTMPQVDKHLYDTLYETDRMTYVITTITDTIFVNQKTGDKRLKSDTVVARRDTSRAPIRESTVFLRDKSGVVRPVKMNLAKSPLEVTFGDGVLPESITFEAFVPLGRLSRDEFPDDLGNLYIVLPTARLRDSYELSGPPNSTSPFASLMVGDKHVATGDRNGSTKTIAFLKIESLKPEFLRKRIMELTFNGTFHRPGTNVNDAINIRIHFRLSY